MTQNISSIPGGTQYYTLSLEWRKSHDGNIICFIYLYNVMYILYIKYENYIKTFYFDMRECFVFWTRLLISRF